MSTSAPEIGPEAYGSKPAGPSQSHQRSLFPDPLAFLRDLIGLRFKEVACELYPKLSVEQACVTLSRNLAGRENRKIGVAEIDRILDVLGHDAEFAWFEFILNRRGFKSPERKPDPVRVQEELAGVRRGLSDVQRVITELAGALQKIEGAQG